MKPYSQALRRRIVQAYERGEGSMRQLAIRFAVSLSCVCDLITRHRATGSVAPKPHGGGYPAKLQPAGLEVVRELVQAEPDATLKDLCTRLHAATQVTVSRPTMSRLLRQLNWPRKKNVPRRRARAPRHSTTARGLSPHPATGSPRRLALS